MKTCNKCGQSKQIDDFYPKRDDFNRICIKCTREYYNQHTLRKINQIETKPKRLTPKQRKTIGIVASKFGLQINQVFIKRRLKPIPMMRKLSFYFLQADMTHEEIAKLVGLNRTSVTIGIGKINNWIESDKTIRSQVESVEKMLK